MEGIIKSLERVYLTRETLLNRLAEQQCKERREKMENCINYWL